MVGPKTKKGNADYEITGKPTTKPRSTFALLAPEDQKRVIDLCNQNTYNEALEIIARPRPEGLQLQSSYGALVRFYAAYNGQARKTNLLSQFAHTVQISRQAHPGALRGGILTMLESRIFEALRRDVPASQLKDEFAILKDFHRGFLSEEKWRTEKDSPADIDWSLHLSSIGDPRNPTSSLSTRMAIPPSPNRSPLPSSRSFLNSIRISKRMPSQNSITPSPPTVPNQLTEEL